MNKAIKTERGEMNSRCGGCGASIPNRGKFHRCSCGSEFSRANLSNSWSVSRIPCPADDATDHGDDRDDIGDDILDDTRGSCFAYDGNGDYGLDADSHNE